MKLFVRYRTPVRFFYLGEEYIELYRVQNQHVEKQETCEQISVFEINSDKFREMLDKIPKESETGVILSSSHFIFNILEFDRIPLREHLMKDLIEWKIKKQFPEDINQYENHFFKLDRKKILSILFRKDLKESIENVFTDCQRPLTFFGNSTIEIMNHVFRGKSLPDFFIEIDNGLCIVVFQSHSIPFYIRKFRIERGEEMIDELKKTLRFVASNFGRKPASYALISHNDEPLTGIQQELGKLELKTLKPDQGKRLFLPG